MIKGDLSDERALEKLIEGTSAIVSCFGTVDKSDCIVEKGIRTLINLIHKQNSPPKLIHISAFGLGNSKAHAKRSMTWNMTVKWIFPLIGKNVFQDMETAENVMFADKHLNFVIARAAVLNNKPARGYRLEQDSAGKLMVSRSDVAAFMVDAIADATYDRQAISVFTQ